MLQSGNRFEADTDIYDLTLLDKVSGSVSFKDRVEAKKLVQLVEDRKVTELVTDPTEIISTPVFAYAPMFLEFTPPDASNFTLLRNFLF